MVLAHDPMDNNVERHQCSVITAKILHVNCRFRKKGKYVKLLSADDERIYQLKENQQLQKN